MNDFSEMNEFSGINQEIVDATCELQADDVTSVVQPDVECAIVSVEQEAVELEFDDLHLAMNELRFGMYKNLDALEEAIRHANIPVSFRISNTSVEVEEATKDGEPYWDAIADRIWVTALARTEEGKGWSVVLAFRNLDNEYRVVTIPYADLCAGNGQSQLLTTLLDNGYWLDPRAKAKAQLLQYLTKARPESRHRLVGQTGWTGDVFMLGNESIGNTNNEHYHLKGGVKANPVVKRGGSFKAWKKMMKLARGNSRLLVAVSLAFAGPLIALLKQESGGIHFYGPSSIGKSTILILAGSVWGGGGPTGFIRQWRTTTNGLEGILKLFTDMVAIMDEIGEAPANQLG